MRCGAPFGEDPSSAAPSHRREQFAAAPHEHVLSPRLVSTLFPHLPRASMASFHASLVAGVGLVLVLGALRILPVAMFAAGVFLPLLTLLYLYDHSVYEDEPTRVIALTIAWGVVTGVGMGLLTRAITSTGAAYLSQSTASTVLDQGILLPLLGIALILVGPALLLVYRRFNDVLDGATFGAAAAVAFAGAEVVTYGFSILSGGLRPAGDVLQWLGKLTTIAIAVPVLQMAAIGAIAGAFWLRYRAPVRDRSALGLLGNPYVALVAGVALILLGFALQPLMPVGWWLVCLLVLDGLALVWLRYVIHVGLLQEAAEVPIGPPITCANCGVRTPRHTFCINCGISLQALPKAPPAPPEPGGEA